MNTSQWLNPDVPHIFARRSEAFSPHNVFTQKEGCRVLPAKKTSLHQNKKAKNVRRHGKISE
jgi:hypothetical protein